MRRLRFWHALMAVNGPRYVESQNSETQVGSPEDEEQYARDTEISAHSHFGLYAHEHDPIHPSLSNVRFSYNFRYFGLGRGTTEKSKKLP